MIQSLNDLLSRLEAARAVTEADILNLRRGVFGDGVVSVVEADAIFRLNDPSVSRAAGWSDFFMEAITDFVVRQTAPVGYVDEGNARWLIAHIARDNRVETMSELRTLVNILKTATDSSDTLVSFALDQVKYAVLEGSGVIGRGRTLKPGVIGDAEVSLLRAVLFACGGEGHISITRTEADILFDINDAVRDADNHESWTLLFRQGIANHLMFISTHNAPSRDEALAREAFLKAPTEIRTFSGLSASGIVGGFKSVFGGDKKAAQDEQWAQNARAAQAEKITADEAAWLKARIGRDGNFDKNERALMTWLEEECPSVHEILQPLLRAA